jgi:hypothetical protein
VLRFGESTAEAFQTAGASKYLGKNPLGWLGELSEPQRAVSVPWRPADHLPVHRTFGECAYGRPGALSRLVALTFMVLFCGFQAIAAPPATYDPSQHSDPLNFDPVVREGYEHIYNLDYDGAISRFDAVLKDHPQDPMAYGYVQMATVFRELYHQDRHHLLRPRQFFDFEAQCAGFGRDPSAHRGPYQQWDPVGRRSPQGQSQ